MSKKEYPELSLLKKYFRTGANPDICIAVGGDGTFIRAARECSCPILPVRAEDKGSVGYYSDLSLSDIEMVADALKNGKYTMAWKRALL